MSRITLQVDGITYVADSSAGAGSCSTCALRSGKQCRWSQVCGFYLAGANFKVQQQPPDLSHIYDGSYSGD